MMRTPFQKRDKNRIKPADKFKRRFHPKGKIKICTKCHKRRITLHHYLCNKCWEQKKIEREEKINNGLNSPTLVQNFPTRHEGIIQKTEENSSSIQQHG